MDFIEEPLLSSRLNSILVIVNQLTKQMIFISFHDTIMSMDLVCLFILHMFSKNSVYSHITSDKGSEFISKIFYSLNTALDI